MFQEVNFLEIHDILEYKYYTRKFNITMQEYSVSQLSQALKTCIENTFSMVRVRGEISGLKRHSSGHVYLSLKDSQSVIDAICWRGQAAALQNLFEEGLEVICMGKLTTYGARSKYQLIIHAMEVAGEGALLKLLEERKKKLYAEGVFDPQHKKALPYLPRTIGIITSPTGSVIRDILHRLRERCPARVFLWPVTVQGDATVTEVCQAIKGFDDTLAGDRPDLIIIARGGGSIEDLWAFNAEEIVRAVFACSIPIISAIGHETDTTLIDYVADHRAPTPTAAAEIAVPVVSDLKIALERLGLRMLQAWQRLGRERLTALEHLCQRCRSPEKTIEEHWQRLDERFDYMAMLLIKYLAMQRKHLETQKIPNLLHILKHFQKELEQYAQRLQPTLILKRIEEQTLFLQRLGPQISSYLLKKILEERKKIDYLENIAQQCSYPTILKKGFALVRGRKGHILTTVKQAEHVRSLSLTFQDGTCQAQLAPHQPDLFSLSSSIKK